MTEEELIKMRSAITGMSRTMSTYRFGPHIFLEAEWLLRIYVRPVHVADLTGIPETRAILMWKEIFEGPTPRGKISESSIKSLITKEDIIHAYLFAYYYAKEGGEQIKQRVVNRALIAGYLEYLRSIVHPAFSGDKAYRIARDMCVDPISGSAALELKHCSRCGAQYLKSYDKITLNVCQFCKIYDIKSDDK